MSRLTTLRKKLPSAALLFVLLSPGSHAQQVPLTGTVDVNVVNVDVWVTDKKGEPVWGLEAKDFQLFEDDERVEIGNFYAETVEARGARSLIVYVDDTGVAVADRNNVLAALLPFVEERVKRDRTPVLVVRFDGGVKVEQDFTIDLEALRTTFRNLGGAEPRMSKSKVLERAMRSDMQQSLDLLRGGGQEQRIARSSMDQVLTAAKGYGSTISGDTRRALDALTTLTAALGSRPGLKILYYVGDVVVLRPLGDLVTTLQREITRLAGGRNYSAQTDASSGQLLRAGRGDGGGGGPNMLGNQENDMSIGRLQQSLEPLVNTPWVQRLGATANSARVILIPIRPPVTDASAAGLGNRASESESALSDKLEGPNLMASLTGGTAMVAGQDVGAFLKRTDEGLSSLYSLGFEPVVRDGFHLLRVKAPRRLKIRHRQSYLAKTSHDFLADRALAVLTMGWVDNRHEMELELDSQTASADGGFDVSVLLTFPIRRLTLVETEGLHSADCRVAIVVLSPEGVLSKPQFMRIPFAVPAQEVAAARDQLLGARLNLRLSAGRQRIAVGLWDSQAGRGSFVEHNLDIGELR